MKKNLLLKLFNYYNTYGRAYYVLDNSKEVVKDGKKLYFNKMYLFSVDSKSHGLKVSEYLAYFDKPLISIKGFCSYAKLIDYEQGLQMDLNSPVLKEILASILTNHIFGERGAILQAEADLKTNPKLACMELLHGFNSLVNNVTVDDLNEYNSDAKDTDPTVSLHEMFLKHANIPPYQEKDLILGEEVRNLIQNVKRIEQSLYPDANDVLTNITNPSLKKSIEEQTLFNLTVLGLFMYFQKDENTQPDNIIKGKAFNHVAYYNASKIKQYKHTIDMLFSFLAGTDSIEELSRLKDGTYWPQTPKAFNFMALLSLGNAASILPEITDDFPRKRKI